MIFVRLVGGLGNQLFQYACARAVSLRCGAELVLDLRELVQPAAHAAYGLHQFAIRARIGQTDELPPPRERIIPYALWRAGFMRPLFMRERGLGLNAAVLGASDDTYLHGYFQSEAYFSDAIASLREELQIVSAISDENRHWLETIQQDDRAVSLHIRRGDYVATSAGQALHGSCDAGYYARAVKKIRERLGRPPIFYVFSDDPGWVRQNLDLGAEMIVLSHNSASSAVEDMRLMGMCRHHIIANSTFSWWGAWRNPSPEKLVIAPQRWFSNPRLSNPDICPADWLRL